MHLTRELGCMRHFVVVDNVHVGACECAVWLPLHRMLMNMHLGNVSVYPVTRVLL